MGVRPSLQLLIVSLMMTMMMKKNTAASSQNFCFNSTVLRTQTKCHSCSISLLMMCPSGYKRSPTSTVVGCRYNIKTVSLNLSISGCSFECYREVEMKSCCPGYWGPDCVDCPDQAGRPCSGRGTCWDGMGGNGTCTCQTGFAGTACEDCAPGRYGPTCSSECSCIHGLCDSGLKGNGLCTCFSGYTGPNCDRELPECAALTCQQNSRCMEEALTGKLVCQCLPGYEKSGSQCISKNPCVQPVCHVHASCVHTGPNQHLCACHEGYSGDGRVCMAIDPCQMNQGGCSPKSTRCIYNGPGKSHCECLPGYESLLDGSCSLRDVCRPESCHMNANCSTTEPGRVECTCFQGYVGNGKVCYGNIMQRLDELNTEPGGQWRGQLGIAISLFNHVRWHLTNLGPFTVFIPINKGFRGFSLSTLSADMSKARYLCKTHLVAGVMPFDTLKKIDVFYTMTGKSAETDTSFSQTKIRIHGSRKKGTVIQSDLMASNGMIHIINKLMDSTSATVDSNKDENLMRIISDYGKFQAFKSLMEEAKLVSLMDAPGLITVFAPTAAAFDAMTEGHLQHLRSPDGHNKLVEFLRNHIVQETALEVFNLVSSPTIVTKANQALTINVTENGQILVNGAAVLEAAVEAKNGRLYVMDGVLTPPSILPVLPNRCNITKTEIMNKAVCMNCSATSRYRCPSGVNTGLSTPGCILPLLIGSPPIMLPQTGCFPLCNTTVTTVACCKGFYGPDCTPCPGGFQTPCTGHGQCMDGDGGNGSCICEENFRGSRCQYCSSSTNYGPNCDRTCPCIHGQCDNRPDSDGRCKVDSCVRGYTGLFCERRTSACGGQVQFCHAHADCDFSQGAPRCVCQPGFQGDGITCVESDPCAPPLRGGCSVNAKCIKKGPGTHICQCLTGWTEDGEECQPINNCLGPDKGGCHPNATCIYVGPGQSDCTCKAGYKGDGQICEAVNQCVTENGSCHYLATCRLISYQWKCVCDDGYVGNGHLCFGTVEQELMILPSATDFFTWTTDSGLFPSLPDQNITFMVPTSAAVGKMSSEDKNFWTTTGNLPSLIRNHMISGNFPLSKLKDMSSVTSLLSTVLPVSTTSEVTSVGRATIITSNIAATNGLIHLIDQVLIPDRKLSEGLLATLALRPEFSLFRSYLIEYNLTNEIEQAEEFTVFAPTDAAITKYLHDMAATALDVNTTRYHVVASECLLKTDLQSGGYKQTLLGSSFELAVFPRDGKLFVNDAQINSSSILSSKGVVHGLSAVLRINRNRCNKVWYQSVLGECVDCLFQKKNMCYTGTTPYQPLRSRSCILSRQFEGQVLVSIGCRAMCLRRIIEPRCCDGFFGEHCNPCPGPKGQPCFGHGACSDGVNGSGGCLCNQGFNGTACETCQRGKYGIHCDQDCVCRNGLCSEGLNGDGTCECDVGWRGIHCDEEIQSTAGELCGSMKCHSSANCMIQTSGPQCLCAAGFQGNGTFCKAVDPCLVDNGGCSLYAVCKRTRPGRRDCVCISGFTGDGLVCVEINPCLEGNGGCHANADCIHVGPNKTSCICSAGYYKDGQNCNMVDLCKKKNGGCHRFAVCNMTGPGTRSCKCLGSYVGDGIKCKGTVEKEIKARGLKNFYFDMVTMEVSLNGRGPFTVFVPELQIYRSKSLSMREWLPRHKETYANVLRSHIVMCHTLLPADLRRPQNLTSLSGLILTTSSTQENIFINQANVTDSDDVSVNGIIHEIDRILFPLDINKDNIMFVPDPKTLNLTDVAEEHGYKTFYKLLEDTGVLDLVKDDMYHPVTIFLPSDGAMAYLPQEQKDFLFHQHNRPQLLEYLKYHILHGKKVYAEELVYLDSPRTLQGSPLSFSCGGSEEIGELFINEGQCRIIQRHLVFGAGIAYGIDCLLTPPSLGGRCDEESTFDILMSCSPCTLSGTRCPNGFKQKEVQKCDLPTMHVSKNTGCRLVCSYNFWKSKCCRGFYGLHCLACPGGAHAPCGNRGICDDGHLGNGTCTCDVGFGGTACELCNAGFFGPTCKACNCSENGSCDDGRKGTGQCFCEDGWTGDLCDVQQTEVFQCLPPCSPKAICKENNTCVCRPFYVGDGYTCTVVDACSVWNGGCAKDAKCSQEGEKVSCTCPKDYSGDGFTCLPIDPCVSGDNGGCHEHATCSMTAPGKKKCTCKDNYLGDGLSCEVMQRPISRCLQDNGQCHPDAKCTDLHFEDATLGVFHYRSKQGQYKLTYDAAQQACMAQGGRLATYIQLSYAQQGGMNICAAGWLDQAQVAYPTTYSNPNCGFGHVGIVDYGVRKNLSETWDTFCYRIKEVKCECKSGYMGDGFSCVGTLLQVLRATPSFSNFLTQILSNSEASESGRQFLKRLSDTSLLATLFVPDNDALPGNQTLSQRDIEIHLSVGQALPVDQLKNGSRIRTAVGSLTVLGVANLLDPSALSSYYINNRFITQSDVPASNGIIHVLQRPLEASPPHQQMLAAPRAGMGVGVVLLVVLVVVVVFVGYHFHQHNTKAFHFHYFKEDDAEDEAAANYSHSICNPVYEASPELTESDKPAVTVEDKHEVVDGGSYGLLQDS